jgi:glycosyltransferase involved in cell wall biosynthesis
LNASKQAVSLRNHFISRATMSTDSAVKAPAVDVSILLTSYNFRPFLRAAVASLLAQKTEFSFEIILVDDASPDRSLDAIADIQDARLQIIAHEQNTGFAASINEAFALARGEFVARLDGDDVWLEDYLQILVSALKANPAAVLAYGNVKTIDAEGQVGTLENRRPVLPAVRDEFENLLNMHHTCAPAMLGRLAAWRTLLPWQERFRSGLGDWHYNLELAKLGPFVYCNQVLAHYRVHAGGMHHTFIGDGVGERNTRFILDLHLPELQRRNASAKPQQIYAQHLVSLAGAHAYQGKGKDARRLYFEALKRNWRTLFQRGVFLPAFGTIILGSNGYAALKRLLGRGAVN